MRIRLELGTLNLLSRALFGSHGFWLSRFPWSWFIAITGSSEPVLFFPATIRFLGHSPLSYLARELAIFASRSNLTLCSATS
jgi:hypothetical protein